MAAPLQFFLPHASVGKAYAQAPQVVNSPTQVNVASIDIDPNTGLYFDDRSQQLTGQPLKAGDYPLTIYYQVVGNGERSPIKTASSTLLINPDPRSLWRNLPSDSLQIYAKPDSDSQLLQTSQARILAASQRGRSHAHKGQFRDDDFFIAVGENWQVTIVADGAGSASYSRYGSYLVCQTVGQYLQSSLMQLDAQQSLTAAGLKNALAAALQQALSALTREAVKQQSELRDYATTLLVVISYRDDVGQYVYLSYGVGDGVIALYQPEQQVQLLSQPDSGEFAGQTRFFNEEAVSAEALASRITLCRSNEAAVLLLMTDGVSDPFFETDNQLKNIRVWDTFWQNLHQQHALANDKSLLQWLDFWSAGNHDDRTIIVALGGQ
jgi:serine/threonine protein phosphatase PrpC